MLHVYSEPNVGTTFKLYLPVASRHVRAELPVPPPLVQRGREHVLLAEDDSAVRNLTRRILENHGYTVTCAANGDAAVSCAKERAFDLILLDVVMPGTPSEQTLERLMALQPTAALLLASGYTGSQVVQLVRTQRLRLLRKPFDPQELLGALRAALDARTR